MPRATNAPASRGRRKRRLEQAKGFMGARSKLFRTATESVNKALVHAYHDRRQRKREMRALWTVRINAACRSHGVSYSRFISGLQKAEIGLDRKILADLAVRDPEGFGRLVERARQAIAS